jgi:uncharacterized protein (DUF58 family)
MVPSYNGTVASQGLCGPYTNLAGLIALKSAAESIRLAPNRKATRQLAGPYQTRLKGRGMDFDEVRGYQPGDDVRNIDWRVTARTTIPHTKTFTEERERPVLILCDQRSTMFFGSRQRFKSVQAANIAALLSWSALKRKDRVGGFILSNREVRDFKAQNSDKAVLTMLAALDQVNRQLQRQDLNGDTQIGFTEALSDLRRIAKTGNSIYIIADFTDLDQDGLRQLYELSRHNSIMAFAVYDPLERELPPEGLYTISNGTREVQIDTGKKQSRRRYAKQAARRSADLHSELGRLGIPLAEIATSDNALDSLSRLFQRARRRTSVA